MDQRRSKMARGPNMVDGRQEYEVRRRLNDAGAPQGSAGQCPASAVILHRGWPYGVFAFAQPL